MGGFQGCEKLVVSKPDLITKDPSVAKFFDIVLFTVTSAEHEQYFKALEPHVKDGTIFAIMPARSGCDFLFRKVMDIKADKLGFAAFETLPWASAPPRSGFWQMEKLGWQRPDGKAAVLPWCRQIHC